ncbi:MAG: hypothetical protein JWP87_3962 [Labilithrix sp.]|nr:hypothetical protein [Labilithrix sp.]
MSVLSVVAGIARGAAGIAWEAPQSTLGAVNFAIELARGGVSRVTRERGRIFVELRGSRAISLGHFVFWSTVDAPIVRVGPYNKEHEYGHALQSRMLGPIYLAVVGVPSTIRVMYAAAQYLVTKKPWDGYYEGFPESWADRLGGVPRRSRAAR